MNEHLGIWLECNQPAGASAGGARLPWPLDELPYNVSQGEVSAASPGPGKPSPHAAWSGMGRGRPADLYMRATG
jgi:hypothetical protein